MSSIDTSYVKFPRGYRSVEVVMRRWDEKLRTLSQQRQQGQEPIDHDPPGLIVEEDGCQGRLVEKHNEVDTEQRYWLSAEWLHRRLVRKRGNLEPEPFRARRLVYINTLTAAQFACLVSVKSYDLCHGNPTRDAHHDVMLNRSCASLHDRLLSYLGVMEHISTTTFVFSAITYGALAMHQYHINRQDRFQQMFLFVGLLAGLATCWDTERIMFPRFPFSITVALWVSANSHSMYAMCLGSRTEKRRAVDSEKILDVDAV
jgi:hypothetical protein